MAGRRLNGLKAKIDAIWPQCAEHLGPALKFAGETHTLEDVRRAILDGKAQLWPVGEHGTIVSEIIETPGGKRICRLWLAGGRMGALLKAEEVVSEWATEQNCDAMEVVGRLGWARVLTDYERAAVVLRKPLGASE